MFTGIVKGLCEVVGLDDADGLRTLHVLLDGSIDQGLETGASIAINGTCLTVSHASGKGTVVVFNCIQETLDKTNLGQLKQGDRVNVERAMKLGDEFGGHQVMGHVDCIGTISKVVESPNNRQVFVRFEPQWSKFLVPKGWICIDGASLTVVSVDTSLGELSVALIPETLARTTLGIKHVDSTVNLEFDHHTKITVLTMERLLPTLLAQELAKRE